MYLDLIYINRYNVILKKNFQYCMQSPSYDHLLNLSVHSFFSSGDENNRHLAREDAL